MHKTEYLYAIAPSVLTNMLYADALEYKLMSARKLIRELVKPHYSKRDDVRLSAVIKAAKHVAILLEELH